MLLDFDDGSVARGEVFHPSFTAMPQPSLYFSIFAQPAIFALFLCYPHQIHQSILKRVAVHLLAHATWRRELTVSYTHLTLPTTPYV